MSEKQWKKILGFRKGDFVKVFKTIKMIKEKEKVVYYYGIIKSYNSRRQMYFIEIVSVDGFKVSDRYNIGIREDRIQTWHPRKPEKWKAKLKLEKIRYLSKVWALSYASDIPFNE